MYNPSRCPATDTLSLHDALPICRRDHRRRAPATNAARFVLPPAAAQEHRSRLFQYGMVAPVSGCAGAGAADRKSTRLNSSHVAISYAVFCLKKKSNEINKFDVVH